MRGNPAHLFQSDRYQIHHAQSLFKVINPLDKENVLLFIWTLAIHSITCKAGEKWVWKKRYKQVE